MRKSFLLALSVTSLAMATASHATVTVDSTTIAEISGPTTIAGTTTIGFTEAGLDSPTFLESLTFTNTLAGLYSISLGTSSASVDFTNALLTGAGGPYNLNPQFDDGTQEQMGLSNLFLDAGQYVLSFGGNNSGNGSVGGTITIAQAVPEPGTWGMMLLGFGAVGFAMRRRRESNGLAQAA